MNRPIAPVLSVFPFALFFGAMSTSSPLFADDGLLVGPGSAEMIPFDYHSGPLANTGAEPAVVYSQLVQHSNAAWMRVVFGEVALSGSETAGNASYLRMTSVLDGAVQTMRASHLAQWQNHSAFFNGDAVLVELVAWPGTGVTIVQIAGAVVGLADDAGSPQPRSICGTEDERQLSFDPRSGRAVSAAGTSVGAVFLIDDPNRTFLTSHATGGLLTGAAVIQFNAPLTFPNGTTLNHPPPEDQYAYDPASIQRMSGTGNNWCNFGCFANSTTGQTPYQRQQAHFDLADVVPAPADQDILVYSFGQTEPPVFRTWSYVQKTSDGVYVTLTGTRIGFQADTSLGDSGAPVIDVESGDVIGIAYEDGCTATAGSNGATAVTNLNLRSALSSPLGVCQSFAFTIAEGTPGLIDNAGAVLRVDVTGLNGNVPTPGSGLLHYTTGSGWLTAPMVDVSPGVYDAVFPAFPCGTLVDYFFSVTNGEGVRFPNPAYPPPLHRSAAASSQTVIASLNFETAVGWTVDNVSLTDGAWELGVPVTPASPGAPSADFDGSGQCWLTDNVAGESDVDGGPTRLRSPSYNLSATTNAFVWFGYWLTNNNNDGDAMVLQVSNNGGLSYVTAQSFTNGAGWREGRFRVDQFAAPTSGVRFRFNVTDNPNNSITEAAVDAFRIIDYQCASVTCTKGDVNQDGEIDGRDIALFTQTMVSGGTPGSVEFCAVDFNSNLALDVVDDSAAFVDCLVNGECP